MVPVLVAHLFCSHYGNGYRIYTVKFPVRVTIFAENMGEKWGCIAHPFLLRLLQHHMLLDGLDLLRDQPIL